MKRRSEQILRRFVKSPQSKPLISELEQEYGISERTLRADIAECNEFLWDLRISGLFVNAAGKLQAGEDFDSGTVHDALSTMGPQHYKLSRDERLAYIELLLLWDDSYQSMQDIADQLGVSRITIMKDVDALRPKMSERGIGVSSETGKGVRACGAVDRRIDLLVERLRDLALESGDEAIFQRLVLERLAPRYSFEDVYAHARDYLDPNSMVVTDEAFYNVILCLFVLLNAPFDVSGAAPHKGEFTKLDGMLAYVCGKLGADPSRDRLVAFANYLEEHHIGSYVRSLDEIEFYEVVIHFLMNLDRELGTSLSSDDVLANALLLHLKSMRDWGDLDFDFT
jgi:mannitol operon transcriptional antiterminator